VAFVKGDHRWGTRPFDKNPRNDTAALVVNASGGGGGDGQNTPGGAQGGTGQGSGPTGGSGDSGHGGGTPGATTRNGTLAATGTDRTPLIGAAVGAALLVAGGYALTSRRRRSGSRVR
jgi:LPXTG-motif cell wall-anchored protein